MASPLKPRRRSLPGFTLLEMVGVLAIMAILSAALAPAALRALNATAVSNEASTVSALGTNLTLYLKANGALPPASNWAAAVATYAGLGSAQVGANPRGIARVYLTDPAASPAPRALILSCMRPGLQLPTAAQIGTAAAFGAIWETADGSVPPSSSWSGWSAWSAVASAGQYLVIGRVNLSQIYATDLQSYPLTLNNRGGAAASYSLVPLSGLAGAAVAVPAGATVVLNEFPRVLLSLYTATGGVGLNYSYVVSTTGRTFDFNGTNWIPQ